LFSLSLFHLAYFVRGGIFPSAPQAERFVWLSPVANLSGRSSADYFSAGLTDEMITQLGRLDPERLGVIAETSSIARGRQTNC